MILKVIFKIALVIVMIGAINWGLVGIFNFNLVSFIFDPISKVFTNVVYGIVGVMGIISVIGLFLPYSE